MANLDPYDEFPLDGGGRAAAVLFGVTLDTSGHGQTDTYVPILVTADGKIVTTTSTTPTASAGFYSGWQRTGATWATPVAICNTSLSISGVQIQSDIRNVGNLFVGGADVNAREFMGRELAPGDVIGLDAQNINLVYIDGLSNQRVLYVATK
jgi:hypothetical protein